MGDSRTDFFRIPEQHWFKVVPTSDNATYPSCKQLLHKAEFVTLDFEKLHSRPFNPLTAKLFNLNFHPLEVVAR